jgi:uncharacterized repeat protein (TIGR03803 family)
MRQLRFSLAFALALLVLALPGLVQAQTLTSLYTYDFPAGGANGGNPFGNMIQASDGNLYGTLLSGGAYNSATSEYGGAIFKLVPSTGVLTLIYSCNATGSDCAAPDGIMELPDGNLYGTANYGCTYGYGCIFKIGMDGSNYQILHAFQNSGGDSESPNGFNIFNPNGELGGTIIGCNSGDGSASFGNCWQYQPDLGQGFSVFTGLLGFTTTGPDGYQPVAGLTLINGNYYGTTQLGGTGGNGVLFYYSTSNNTATVLEDFSGGPSSSYPSGTPKLYSDNNIYGTTLANYPAGNPNDGSVWKSGLTSGFTTLYDFQTPVAYSPFGPVTFDTAGNIIFTAQGDRQDYPNIQNYGELFLEPRAGGSTSLKTLYTFTENSAEGDLPQNPPFFDSEGHLWTLQLTGGGNEIGSVDEWSLSTETTPPIKISASPATIAPSASTTVSWSTNNSFSDNEKYCFGSGNGDTNWDGVQQTGTYSGGILSGSTVFQPTATGDYVFAITCGGTESALATVHVRLASATTLKASANPVNAGNSETLSVSVSGNGTAPTGVVTLSFNGTTIGTITLSNGSGNFAASTTGLPAGSYAVTASYPGDLQYAGSSANLTITVTGASATSTTLTATPNPVATGATVKLAATVKKTTGTGTPTGNVTFKSGTTTLATVGLSGGVATLSAPTTGYPLGTYPITASYAGDANDVASTSSTVNLVVANASTTALSITPSSVKVGGNVTLKATVSATAGGTPTGTVNFVYNGSTLVSATLSGGVASVTVPTTGYPVATYSITAVYTGNSGHAGSTSAPATVTLTN